MSNQIFKTIILPLIFIVFTYQNCSKVKFGESTHNSLGTSNCPIIKVPKNLKVGEEGNFEIQSQPAPKNIQWNFGDSDSSNIDATGILTQHIYSNEGVYTGWLRSSNDCLTHFTVEVEPGDTPNCTPQTGIGEVFNIVSPNNIEVGDTALFRIELIANLVIVGNINYSITDAAGTEVSSGNLHNISNNTYEVSFLPSYPSNYRISVNANARSSDNCVNIYRSAQDFTVGSCEPNSNTIELTYTPDTIHTNEQIRFHIINSEFYEDTSYQWNIDGTDQHTNENPITHEFYTEGAHWVLVRAIERKCGTVQAQRIDLTVIRNSCTDNPANEIIIRPESAIIERNSIGNYRIENHNLFTGNFSWLFQLQQSTEVRRFSTNGVQNTISIDAVGFWQGNITANNLCGVPVHTPIELTVVESCEQIGGTTNTDGFCICPQGTSWDGSQCQPPVQYIDTWQYTPWEICSSDAAWTCTQQNCTRSGVETRNASPLTYKDIPPNNPHDVLTRICTLETPSYVASWNYSEYTNCQSTENWNCNAITCSREGIETRIATPLTFKAIAPNAIREDLNRVCKLSTESFVDSWEYSDWGECQGGGLTSCNSSGECTQAGTQNRTATAVSWKATGPDTAQLDLSRSCTIASSGYVEQWQYSNWSSCRPSGPTICTASGCETQGTETRTAVPVRYKPTAPDIALESIERNCSITSPSYVETWSYSEWGSCIKTGPATSCTNRSCVAPGTESRGASPLTYKSVAPNNPSTTERSCNHIGPSYAIAYTGIYDANWTCTGTGSQGCHKNRLNYSATGYKESPPAATPPATRIYTMGYVEEYSAGNWSNCSNTCGSGVQTRTIDENAWKANSPDASRPISERACNTHSCPVCHTETRTGYDYAYSNACNIQDYERQVCNNGYIGNWFPRVPITLFSRCSSCPQSNFGACGSANNCRGALRHSGVDPACPDYTICTHCQGTCTDDSGAPDPNRWVSAVTGQCVCRSGTYPDPEQNNRCIEFL